MASCTELNKTETVKIYVQGLNFLLSSFFLFFPLRIFVYPVSSCFSSFHHSLSVIFFLFLPSFIMFYFAFSSSYSFSRLHSPFSYLYSLFYVFYLFLFLVVSPFFYSLPISVYHICSCFSSSASFSRLHSPLLSFVLSPFSY